MKIPGTHISNAIRRLREHGAVILLESQMHKHLASTKSYLAAKPEAWIKCRGSEIEIFDADGISTHTGNPWDELQAFRKKHQDWLFGYLGYDLKNHLEELDSGNEKLTDAPDLYFMVPGILLEIDGDQNITRLKGALPTAKEEAAAELHFEVHLQNRISKTEYLDLIEQAKRDIYEGDYYEINLSHPLQFHFEGDSLSLYESMKASGPVPFGGYAEIDGLAVCCSSPERFLARKGNRVWSQPIKGTASRKKDADSKLDVLKLRESEKERAENLMIVDLVRNDLGRVALKNSVKVSNLFEIQSFETVHQMVSTVECSVGDETESVDVIKACFPMGSMTGAPKISVMKAIEKYEHYRRGIYSGALGYFAPNGNFDFNVVIRTAIIEANKLIYPVGGAITSDSDAEAEWEETLLKAKAITNIFENAEKPE